MLFPIINNHENQWCEPYSFDIGYIQSGLKNDDKYGGIEINSFPVGLSHADAIIINDSTPEQSPEQLKNDNPTDVAGTPTLSDDQLIDIETGNYNGHYESIKIIAGFIGYSQHQLNYSLSPIIGWFVVSNDGNNHGYRHLGILHILK